MLGNDVVDLKLASVQSNWRRKGFLGKIFNKAEQNLIEIAASPDVKIWQLWTLKEAAYKIYNRQTGIRTFEPSCILCTVDDDEIGRVQINKEIFFTKSIIALEYIHTTAALSLRDLHNCSVNIYRGKAKRIDYHALNPKSVSHHGDYLALVDFC